MRTYICPFCGIELNPCNVKHIYYCKENKTINDKNEIRLRYLEYNFGKDGIQNILEDYQNLFSLPMLKEKYGIDFKSVIFLTDYYGIHKRTSSESAIKISHEKFKKTCLQKYNVDNISKLDEIKQKKSKTFADHYGVDNIWKLSDYNKKCAELYPESHAEHIEKLHKGRDDYWENITEEEQIKRRKKISQTYVKKNYYASSLETRFCLILEELGISYTRQFHLKGDRHPYDFRLVGTNIIVEINGDFWHANPLLFEAENTMNYPDGKKKAYEVWERDKNFILKAENNGFKVITIWEQDMKKMDNDELCVFFEKILKDIKNE